MKTLTDKQRIDWLEKMAGGKGVEKIELESYDKGRSWELTIFKDSCGYSHWAEFRGTSMRNVIDEARKVWDEMIRVQTKIKAQKKIGMEVKARHMTLDWWDTDSPITEFRASISFLKAA